MAIDDSVGDGSMSTEDHVYYVRPCRATLKANTVRLLSQATGQSVEFIRKQIQEREWIRVCELFGPDHEREADKLLWLWSKLDDAKIAIEIKRGTAKLGIAGRDVKLGPVLLYSSITGRVEVPDIKYIYLAKKALPAGIFSLLLRRVNPARYTAKHRLWIENDMRAHGLEYVETPFPVRSERGECKAAQTPASIDSREPGSGCKETVDSGLEVSSGLKLSDEHEYYLRLDSATESPEILELFQEATGEAADALRERLRMREWIRVCELFGPDHEREADKLLNLCMRLNRISRIVVELKRGATWIGVVGGGLPLGTVLYWYPAKRAPLYQSGRVANLWLIENAKRIMPSSAYAELLSVLRPEEHVREERAWIEDERKQYGVDPAARPIQAKKCSKRDAE